MSTGTTWALIGLCAAVTVAIKGLGPGAMGARPLPPAFVRVVTLLAAPLLTALVATQALADGHDLGVGADTVGVAVAGLALWRRVGILPAVLIAAAVTAALRAAGW